MKDYRLIKEKLFWIIVPIGIMALIGIINECIWTKSTGFLNMDAIILQACYVCVSIYLMLCRIKRYLFLKQGVAYKGKVVGFTTYYGKISRYSVYIQLQYKGDKKIIKSGQFNQKPTNVLCSDKCIVFVRKGKFYPCMFDYSKKKTDKKIELPMKCK